MFIIIITGSFPQRLENLISGLSFADSRFLIVDNGSECGLNFASLPSDRISILRFEKPVKRGRAIKSAFKHIIDANERNGVMIINDNCSVQHARKVMDTWLKSQSGIVMGIDKSATEQSTAHRLTRLLFAVTSGTHIGCLFPEITVLPPEVPRAIFDTVGDGDDYDVYELLYAVNNHIEITEVPFYDSDGTYRRGAFKLIRDSWQVYSMILRFMLSSFGCFLIDYSILLSLSAIMKGLPFAIHTEANRSFLPILGFNADIHLIALVTARLVSSFCNYLLNRRLVFHSASRISLVKYYLLLVLLLSANYLLISLLTCQCGLGLWLAQPIVQLVLYPANFILQRKWVFPDGKNN